MARASGSLWQVSHVTESSLGTPSGTAFTKDRLLMASAGIKQARTTIESQEATADRSPSPIQFGNKNNTFGLSGNLIYGAHEDYLASLFMNAFAAAASAITGLSATVVAGSTNTISATGIATGIYAGDWVKISGFTSPYTANNGFKRVSASATGVLTFAGAIDPESGASTLAACTSQTGVSVQKMGYLVVGTTEKSMAIEEAETDIAVYQELLGAIVKSMNLSFTLDQLITCNFDMIAKSLVGPAASAYAGSYVAATTNAPIKTSASGNVFMLDGVPIAYMRDGNITFDGGRTALFSAGLENPTAMGVGQIKVTGNLTMYLQDSSFITKIRAGTSLALCAQAMDSSGSYGYVFDMPKLVLNPETLSKAADNITQQIQFTAQKDSSTSVNCMRIWKLA